MKLFVRESSGEFRPAKTREALAALRDGASQLLKARYKIISPTDCRDYLQARIGGLEHEVFAILWLNNRNEVIHFDEMFRGTIDGASVHVREVVKAALGHNAAACILTHNHPSGSEEPSSADLLITNRLRDALALIEIRVLDHLIVGPPGTVAHSFAEHGQL